VRRLKCPAATVSRVVLRPRRGWLGAELTTPLAKRQRPHSGSCNGARLPSGADRDRTGDPLLAKLGAGGPASDTLPAFPLAMPELVRASLPPKSAFVAPKP
jgi:hypothetical protein